MARKSIEKYFPDTEPPVYVGGWVPLELRTQAKAILKQKRLQYCDLIRAAMQMLVKENGGVLLKLAQEENKYGVKK